MGGSIRRVWGPFGARSCNPTLLHCKTRPQHPICFVEGINRSLGLDLPPTNRVQLCAIETAVSRWQKYPVAMLHTRTKEHRGSFARAVVAYLGQELGAVRLAEVAARYGRNQVRLSLGIKRLRERITQESDLSENIAGLLKQLRGRKIKLNN